MVGPAGLGILSVLMNLSTLITSVFPIGNAGLGTYIAKLKDENKKKVNYLLKHFLKLNIFIIVIFILVLMPFSSQISVWLFNDDKFYLYIILFLVSVPFSLLYSFVDLYLRGIRAINVFVLISSVVSVLSLIVFVPMVYLFELNGAILSIVIAPVISSFLSIYIVKKYNLYPDLSDCENISQIVKTNIIKVGLSSVIIMIIQNLVYLFIRTKILSTLGEDQVGLYQAVYAISNNYFSIFFALMSIYSMPRLSVLKDSMSKIKEINTTLKFMLLLYTPMIIIFYVFRFQIIPLFYSNSFLKAESLLFYQLLGDFFKVLSWVMGLWLLPSLRIKEWFIFELFYYLVFSFVFYFLITFYQPDIIFASMAYLSSYFLYFLVQFSYILYKLKFKFNLHSFKLLALSSIAIAVCFIASRFYNDVSVYVFLIVFPIWTVFVLNKSDYVTLMNILRNKKILK